MTENSPEDETDVTVSINLYPEDGEVKALRQIGLGLQPLLLLEMEATDEGVQLNVVGSLIDDLDELVETLEGFAEAVKAAVEQQRESEADDLLAGSDLADTDQGFTEADRG